MAKNKKSRNHEKKDARKGRKSGSSQALINLSKDLSEKGRRPPMPFSDFLDLTADRPEFVFRDIFRLFYDMVHYYIPEGVDEYGGSEDSIGYVHYDTSRLLVKKCDNPFFADRPFSNRLMDLTNAFKEGGARNNNIFLFEGPPGSGKSTFLNNLLFKLEEYIRLEEGTIYKTYWRLDIEKLGGLQQFKRAMRKVADENGEEQLFHGSCGPNAGPFRYPKTHLEFSCPKHDHPILQIPKENRKKFLDDLISDPHFKEKLFNEKEYEWVLTEIPCSICRSIFFSLVDILGDPLEAYKMIYARKAHYNRQFGEGITIFNPGDPLNKRPISRPNLQHMINNLVKADRVEFVFSDLAKTNNGVLALMDIKDNNVNRLINLHGIISDGVHKVSLVEEHIKSLFVGLINPADRKHYEQIPSFKDRIITVKIPYVLDYNTEVAIYKNKFGRAIRSKFLPTILENVAKIIISSRLNRDCPAIKKWIPNPEKYGKYLDKHCMLLKMDIYTGKIPPWLKEEDLKCFDQPARRAVIGASEREGVKGFSGRQSLLIFQELLTKCSKFDHLITMDMAISFFKKDELYNKEIPEGFLDSIGDMYDYNVLQEMKEAIYHFSESQISRDIKNYLFAINFEIGATEKCEYTGDIIDISEEYFEHIEAIFLGNNSKSDEQISFRKDLHSEYITKTLAQEIRLKERPIEETEQFKALFEKYTKNLKEYSLVPYLENENFRRAILDYETTDFKTYDKRLKRDVSQLMSNLTGKFNYSPEGAKQICIYVLDKDLAKKY